MPKFLRSIRFDDSDDHVFSRAALPDEWVVSGGQTFQGINKSDLKGKLRQDFANGFLGIESLGRSTFASVADCTVADIDLIKAGFIENLMQKMGAPSIEAAAMTAQAESDFILSLAADQPVNTIYSIRRVLDESGEIREEFRTIAPPRGEPAHARIWEIIEDET